jgi:predicted PurR-regulated permease PerM
MSFFRDVDNVFGRYISAKLLLGLIMFINMFIAFSFLRVRYSLLMSSIVAVTTLVPYLGAFVGAVPPILIALLDSPEKCIYVTIAIIVIQQIDNYVFQPFVFSGRMGLSPFWVLLSIIVGGGLFGLWGMVLAMPVAGVIKLLITRYIRIRQIRRMRQTGEDAPEAESPEAEKPER